jgi:hypothetical protein
VYGTPSWSFLTWSFVTWSFVTWSFVTGRTWQVDFGQVAVVHVA